MPALAFGTNAVFNRHAHIVEKHFGEGVLAIQRLDRPDGHARGIERHHHERQAVVPGRGRVAAEQAKQPVGKQCAAGPGFLPVEHIVIAITDGLAGDRGHVGAGIGLGPALGPHVDTGRHARQEALLLRLGTELHQRWAEQ
ncbi:hypothetical protein D3C80_1047380 [compost metagenome]